MFLKNHGTLLSGGQQILFYRLYKCHFILIPWDPPSFSEREAEATGRVGKRPPASGCVRDRDGVGCLCGHGCGSRRLVPLLGLKLVAYGKIVQMIGVPQF